MVIFIPHANIAPDVVDVHHAVAETNPSEIHVLAVDDSLIDRKVVERLLRTSAFKGKGHKGAASGAIFSAVYCERPSSKDIQVTTVDSGLRALEILGVGENHSSVRPNNAYCFNLIITDYCMPGMTGYDLLKRVKGTSDLREIPVVILSSDNVPNRIKRCLAEGAEEFIIKPLQLSDVKRLRRHICQGKLRNIEAPAPMKRKAPSETLQAQSAERRPHLDCVTVPLYGSGINRYLDMFGHSPHS